MTQACDPQLHLFAIPAPLSTTAILSDHLALCVLGSGSAGNSTVLHARDAPAKKTATKPRPIMLIDAGFGPRTTDQRLARVGAKLDDVAAICLTHLDCDHFRPNWPRHLLRRGIHLYLHHAHLPKLLAIQSGQALCDAGLARVFDGRPFTPIPGVTAHGVGLSHDRHGTVGYRFTGREVSIGYATDLGHVPQTLIDHFAGVHLLCLESNYDPDMTLASGRPAYLNRRNMSDAGHLSNHQAFAAVRDIARSSPDNRLSRVVLMHRSRQCNHLEKVTAAFAADPRLADRIALAEQDQPSGWFEISA